MSDWRDNDNVKAMKAAVIAGDDGAMPVLADAMEQAGCPDAKLLAQLRSLAKRPVLAAEGIVTQGDAYRCADDDEKYGSVHVGDFDVVDEITDVKWFYAEIRINRVVVARGEILADTGCGYSPYTPLESDFARIDPIGDSKGFDIVDELLKFVGESVFLVIEEEFF